MTRRLDTVRWVACALEFFVLYLLSATPNLLPAVGGVLPVPLAAAAVTAAMFESELPAMGFGIFAGMLIDFGMGSVMGFHAGVLAVLCFAAAWLCRNLFRVNLLTCAVLCFAGAGILFGLQWVFFCLVPEQTGAGHIFVRYILPRALYSALFFLPAYPVSRALFNATAPGAGQ